MAEAIYPLMDLGRHVHLLHLDDTPMTVCGLPADGESIEGGTLRTVDCPECRREIDWLSPVEASS